MKKKCDFPPRARALLKSWFVVHAQGPYPSHEEKIKLAREGGISMKQLENWLTNTRGRIWKKMRHETKFDTEIEHLLLNNEDKVLQSYRFQRKNFRCALFQRVSLSLFSMIFITSIFILNRFSFPVR